MTLLHNLILMKKISPLVLSINWDISTLTYLKHMICVNTCILGGFYIKIRKNANISVKTIIIFKIKLGRNLMFLMFFQLPKLILSI